MTRFLITLFFACFVLPLSAQDASQAPRTLRVLFVGNSLVYVNNLPAVLRAVAGAQPVPVVIDTQTFVAPGGTVAERWSDGHAADALAAGQWDFVVLQERGGLLACMVDPEQRTSSECRASDAFGGGAASVDARKRGRLVRAADIFLKRMPSLAQFPCRFDVVEATGDPAHPRLRWLRAAFRADD